jgi:hypothetical protein
MARRQRTRSSRPGFLGQPSHVPAATSSGSRPRRRWWIRAALISLLVAVIVTVITMISRWPRGPSRLDPSPLLALQPATDENLEAAARAAATTSPVQLGPPTRVTSDIQRLARKQPSRADDWDTEVLSDLASQQLDQLQSWLESPELPSVATLEAIVVPAVTFDPLRPSGLVEVYRHAGLTVRRAELPGEQALQTARSLAVGSGVASLRSALRELKAALGEDGDCHVKFKLFRIEPQANGFVTRVRYEASLQDTQGSRQQSATWTCEWTQPAAPHEAARLRRLRLNDYEEVDFDFAGGRLFVDCTSSVLGANPAYAPQVLPGINFWLRRISREFMSQFGHHGLAVGDVNGDGLDDLYVCDAGGLPNRLYLQQSDGTARDVSAEAGVDLLEDSVGALLVDLDNDGDQDLVVGTDPLLQIAENDGRGRFTWRAAIDVNTDPFSLSAADYDQDGDLDIYVCGYNVRKQDPTQRGLPFPVPYHDAMNGGRNLLLRNDGQFRFVDTTAQVGLDANNSRFSMAAAWEDFDNDGDLDLYVANDFGRNNLYRNDGGRFTDIAAQAGVEDHGSGMSVAWNDYNRDGRMDLYVGNMFSAAGNRVTYQRRFADGRADETVSHLRRMARGNTLFSNQTRDGQVEFVDVSEPTAVWLGRWAWASKFVDLTNDSWPDLVIANGYVTNDMPDDL